MQDASPPVENASTADGRGVCPSCGAVRVGRFCHACGEKRLEPEHDHSLRWLFVQVLEGVAQFDTKLLRTFGALLFRPGQLTRDHLEGRRVRHLPPLQVFFVTSVLFYLFFERAYAAPVGVLAKAYAQGGWVGNVLHYDIAGAITAKAAASGQSVDVLVARVFDRASQESKLFLGLLVPFLAGVLHLLFRRQWPRYVPHFVAAVHAFTVFLCFDLVFLFGWRLAGANEISDLMFLPLLLGFGVHVVFAVRRVYGAGAIAAVLKTLVVLAWLVALIIVYRQFVTVAAAVLLV